MFDLIVRDRHAVLVGDSALLRPAESLVEAGLGGCILLSTGTLAMRHGIDLTAARVDVKIRLTEPPVMRSESIDLSVEMPCSFRSRIALCWSVQPKAVRSSEVSGPRSRSVHYESPAIATV